MMYLASRACGGLRWFYFFGEVGRIFITRALRLYSGA